MTTVAVMQPYFFPYIGYFQLIDAADVFVHFDDVQYIDRGWSNRNRILNSGKAQLLTYPVKNASRDLPYKEREYRAADKDQADLIRAIEYAYVKAPQFGSVMPLLEGIVGFTESNVAAFNANLIQTVCAYLGIPTQLVFSSSLGVAPALRAQAKIIETCRRLGADRYVNASGGVALYDREAFAQVGMELAFIAPELQPYRQFKNEPIVGLSVIDVIMFNSVDEVRGRLWRSHFL